MSGQTGFRPGTEVAFTGAIAPEATYEGIFGKPRIISLFDDATGQGTNAQFRITKFVMARIVAAQMSGNLRGIVFQPITKKDDPHKVRLVR